MPMSRSPPGIISSGSTSTSSSTPTESSSPFCHAKTSDCSFGSREALRLAYDQILVKISHVNDALTDLKTEVYDDEGQEECHFVRIVRIGPRIKNKESTVPGSLVITHKRRGIYLDDISREYGEDYYLLLEGDIMTYIDL